MLEEIVQHNPDIICLQEVDNFEFLRVKMKQLDSSLIKRSLGKYMYIMACLEVSTILPKLPTFLTNPTSHILAFCSFLASLVFYPKATFFFGYQKSSFKIHLFYLYTVYMTFYIVVGQP